MPKKDPTKNSKWVFVDIHGDRYTVTGVHDLARARAQAYDAGARGELKLVEASGKGLMALYRSALG